MNFCQIFTVLLTFLLVCGCIIREKDSGELITIGGKRELKTSFDKCEKLMTLDDISNPHNDDYVIQKSYRYDKTCVRLHVGMYGDMQRLGMSGSPVAGGMFRQRNAGSFEAARNLWDKVGITCVENITLLQRSLSLQFPKGHRNYRHIDLSCEASDMLHVSIGLYEKDSDRLAITIQSRKEGRESIFDAFNTDRYGVIKKHVVVVGAGGKEKVMLDE